ncbi:hypothetical protein FRC08_018478 [Ceratobasidium sp. 394]|nr:hypothetical protein FRC08_018478 [Ceratobasidium sp. 394]KAG9099007.1 hypothetical protein FS749_002355 [Ceratobasidium sp. UAMH 11750]
MSKLSHPVWGRVIGSYLVPSDLEQLDLSVDSELAGLQAMQEISQLATEVPQVKSTNDIHISTLESALLLSRDPATIRHLTNPPVISGCIRLMKTVIDKSSNRVASPFAYEYGYLCFKLLVAALNICLLERWSKVEEALTLSDRFLGAAAHIPFWIILAREVDSQFDVIKAGGDCDWVLGWSASIQHLQQTPLLLRSDILGLLDLLWDGRKHLLLALVPYTPPSFGLSGLLFLLSRFVSRERNLHNNPDWKVLNARVHEIALRYLLVASEYQREAILRVVHVTKNIDTWTESPKHIDVQDSRLIMTAFIHALSGGDKSLLLTEAPYMMLRLVSLATDAATQDLIPEVIRLTIEYDWLRLLDTSNRDNVEVVIRYLFGSMYALICPGHNRPFAVTPSIRSQIINTMHTSDFLDLTARAIISLKPAQSSSEAKLHHETFGGLAYFFDGLAKAVPESELECCFRGYIADWWKFNHQLIIEYCMPAVPSKSHQEHYDLCMEVWIQIAQFLGLESAIGEFASVNCHSGRCPMAYPTVIQGARFGCGRCARTLYCDDRCQAMDWKFGGINPPHQQLCGDNPSYAFRRE